MSTGPTAFDRRGEIVGRADQRLPDVVRRPERRARPGRPAGDETHVAGRRSRRSRASRYGSSSPTTSFHTDGDVDVAQGQQRVRPDRVEHLAVPGGDHLGQRADRIGRAGPQAAVEFAQRREVAGQPQRDEFADLLLTEDPAEDAGRQDRSSPRSRAGRRAPPAARPCRATSARPAMLPWMSETNESRTDGPTRSPTTGAADCRQLPVDPVAGRVRAGRGQRHDLDRHAGHRGVQHLAVADVHPDVA